MQGDTLLKCCLSEENKTAKVFQLWNFSFSQQYVKIWYPCTFMSCCYCNTIVMQESLDSRPETVSSINFCLLHVTIMISVTKHIFSNCHTRELIYRSDRHYLQIWCISLLATTRTDLSCRHKYK